MSEADLVQIEDGMATPSGRKDGNVFLQESLPVQSSQATMRTSQHLKDADGNSLLPSLAQLRGQAPRDIADDSEKTSVFTKGMETLNLQ